MKKKITIDPYKKQCECGYTPCICKYYEKRKKRLESELLKRKEEPDLQQVQELHVHLQNKDEV